MQEEKSFITDEIAKERIAKLIDDIFDRLNKIGELTKAGKQGLQNAI